MNAINERFKDARRCLKKNQEEWGCILGITRPGVSDIESGRRNVTEKHIKLLCVGPINGKYVNEDWLRTGAGGNENMFIPEDMVYLQNVGQLGGEKNEFKKFYLNMMMNLPDDYWDYIYKEFKKFDKKEGE